MTTLTGVKCITETCSNPRSSKSTKGYCSPCSKLARANWIETIKASAAARADKELEFTALTTRAHEAGMRAADDHVTVPMVVCTADGVPIERVSGGVCGFAWIVVRPGNSPLANYLKKHAGGRKDYYGGVQVWCPLGTQSMTTKEAYCHAYAEVLRDAGHKAYSQSRMD